MAGNENHEMLEWLTRQPESKQARDQVFVGQMPEPPSRPAAATPAAPAAQPHDLRKSIRSWGPWLLGWGVLNAATGGIPFGIMMSFVGLMSFYFSEQAEMFIVYGGVMLWTALSNALVALSGGDGAFWATIQVISAVAAFKQYRKYRHLASGLAESNEPSARSNGRSRQMMWLAPALGVLGVSGFCILFSGGVIAEMAGRDAAPLAVLAGYGFMTSLAIGVLAIPVGAAALLSSHRNRAAGLAGIVLGGLALMLYVAVLLLGNLGS